MLNDNTQIFQTFQELLTPNLKKVNIESESKMNRKKKPYSWNDVEKLSREQEVKELSKNNSSLCRYIETVQQVLDSKTIHISYMIMVDIKDS